MDRQPRDFRAGITYHLTQRANYKQFCFRDNQDFSVFKKHMMYAKTASESSVHAYVIMSNHMHILVTGNLETSVSKFMKLLNGRYERYFNKKHNEVGTLWGGRFHAEPAYEAYIVMNMYKYIELNPVKARLVMRPEDYEWSSFRCNALNQSDDLVTPHEYFMDLGADPPSRAATYKEFVAYFVFDPAGQPGQVKT
ncbi:MAG: transposase [Idiomarinaceae bacterium HL-53]|nr:MAG: transposase [Idiomarinaceae bacterium HL-53]CUS47148.1 putative transposase [Idiomarinaceae bacterium HL-53]